MHSKFALAKLSILPVVLFSVLASALLVSTANAANTSVPETQSTQARFAEFYSQEWGGTQRCKSSKLHRYTVCANLLRNEGNAPFMLQHDTPSKKVAVLIHGLSDSPFFMREIANILFNEGYDVIVPLLPGHGLRDADGAMADSDLAERWQAHVDDVIALADDMGDTLIVGGFSTGGALAVDQYLDASDNIDGLMLFSGALALSENAESMSRIWGIKWVAKLVDGSYITHGPNPFKYPNVAGFAGLELMDIIDKIRDDFENGKRIEIPLFAAHSQADATTPIHGVEHVMENSAGPNTFFVIDASYELCHADLVVNTTMLHDIKFNKVMVNEEEECAVPKANPLFSTMSLMLKSYIQQF
ncbi:alpha/beta fold hydrolase [Alteromonas sp. 1_MG-2023]|uniref:alpha/beta hydrolase n=1 Tax=Alteromonas sp. 1_MG-2023 TaxID=3062669 RepID=UPI0026E2F06F|nr:alpha/beta fold hydrolase [Alteromonas sp. 1_MG-2023]MDO6568335.1 alpha/beta fold hydrolase [Alteromonas sp. 1_MG-2023]